MPRTSRRSTPTFRTRPDVRERMAELLAEYPDRNFSPEAREQWNELADVDHEFDVREQFLVEQSENPGAIDEDRSRPPGTARPDNRAGAVRSQALRANERAEFLPDDARAHMERTITQDDDP